MVEAKTDIEEIERPAPTMQPGSWFQRMVRSLFRIGAVSFLVSMSMLYFLQRKMIYVPTQGEVSTQDFQGVTGTIENIKIVAPDGVVLHGWLTYANSETRNEGAVTVAEFLRGRLSPLVLYFQGNAGNRARRGMQVAMLNELGCDVLIVDYRGYGENAGTPSEAALAGDARSISKFVTQEWDVAVERQLLFGESLGGGVATGLCHELCAAGQSPAGLIIRASFSSLADVASERIPWLPVRWILVDRYPSLDRIPEISCPIVILHGEKDEIIPFEHGERLFAAAPEKSANGIEKRFTRLTNTGHNDIMYVAGDQVREGLQPFLQDVHAILAEL